MSYSGGQFNTLMKIILDGSVFESLGVIYRERGLPMVL